jgi:pimeloyl-ACP methyl ester carboxylesterase
MATSTMWAPNIADFSTDHRVYAVDVMGQPSKSIPGEPVRNALDYTRWLTTTLDALHLGRISLLGMSYGGWLALHYAVTAPERVERLALLSAGGLVPVARQFRLRGMLMMFIPTRLTVSSFMRWLGFSNRSGDSDARPVLDLMYLGLKHFRLPPETLRVMPTVVADEQLRALHVPTLLLMGDHEVMFDAPAALARARRLIPDVEAALIPRSSHDMCFTQHRLVDARVLDFFARTKTENENRPPGRVVA